MLKVDVINKLIDSYLMKYSTDDYSAVLVSAYALLKAIQNRSGLKNSDAFKRLDLVRDYTSYIEYRQDDVEKVLGLVSFFQLDRKINSSRKSVVDKEVILQMKCKGFVVDNKIIPFSDVNEYLDMELKESAGEELLRLAIIEINSVVMSEIYRFSSELSDDSR